MSSQQTDNGYVRFDVWQRLEHGLLILSFTVLAVSGLPQKYPDSQWGSILIGLMGGIETTRFIHHTAAIVLMAETVFHILDVIYKVWVKRAPMTIMPTWQDVKDAWQSFMYNWGFVEEPPKMGRYTFAEKAEYWALIWGTLIMIITGLMLWNPIAATALLPGQFIPAAKAAHGGEALLAVLSILTWHVYHVHIKHFNKSMFTGKISRHEMEEEHPQELAAIESGQVAPLPENGDIARRRRIFIPLAAGNAVALLSIIYIFVTFEQTAITTVPRPVIVLFSTLAP